MGECLDRAPHVWQAVMIISSVCGQKGHSYAMLANCLWGGGKIDYV